MVSYGLSILKAVKAYSKRYFVGWLDKRINIYKHGWCQCGTSNHRRMPKSQDMCPITIPKQVPFLSDGRCHRLSLKRNQRGARHGGNYRASFPRALDSFMYSRCLCIHLYTVYDCICIYLRMFHVIHVNMLYLHVHLCLNLEFKTTGSLSNICPLCLQVCKIMV